jgi:hypothetical protein
MTERPDGPSGTFPCRIFKTMRARFQGATVPRSIRGRRASPFDFRFGNKWCGRGESNPHGQKPNGFSYLLRLSPPFGGSPRMFVVWTIPSPCLVREHRV